VGGSGTTCRADADQADRACDADPAATTVIKNCLPDFYYTMGIYGADGAPNLPALNENGDTPSVTSQTNLAKDGDAAGDAKSGGKGCQSLPSTSLELLLSTLLGIRSIGRRRK
jgi:hypothetical protein